MGANVWAVVGGNTFQLPMEALLGTANQILGMNAGATALQYKAATFDNATNQFAVPVGAVGAPSYTFTGQLTSGFYFDAALSAIAIALGGTRKGYITASKFFLEDTLQLSQKLLQEDFGADIAFADGITDIGGATGNTITLTNAAGNKVVTSLGGDTIPAGTEIETIISITGGTVSLTHNAVSLDLLGEVNTPLADRDVIRWRKTNDASPYWRMVSFQRGLSSTPFTAKGDLLVGKAVGALIQQSVKPVGANNTVPIADSAQDDGIRWGAIASPPVRQTVLAAALTGAGFCNILSAGAALNFNVEANPTSALLTFAEGFNAGGQVDKFSFISADAANQGALVASNTNYIYANFVSSSTVTWGQCLIPPQYGYAFDRTEGAILNFEGADASTVIIDEFGNSWSAQGNAQIDTAQFKFGASSLLLDGTGDYVESLNISTLGDGSWEMSTWFRIAALPGVGGRGSLIFFSNAASRGARLALFNAAGITKLEVSLSSDGATNNIADGNVGINTVWTLNQWNKARLVFDALAGTYRVYLSLNGAAETQDISIANTTKICALTLNRLGIDNAGANAFNGWLDAFRFIHAATITTTEVPVAVAPSITDYPIHFFSIPEMKMYEVTGASVLPATNPTFIQRTRLFIGECDTDVGTVTAVRNYAIRGQFISTPVAHAALSTTHSFNHNIGTKEIRFAASILVGTTVDAAAANYSVGQLVPLQSQEAAATLRNYDCIGGIERNTGKIYINDGNLVAIRPGAGPASFLINIGHKIILRAERIF